MNETIHQFLISQIKPTTLPLYTDIINYLTELNFLENATEIDRLIDATLKDEINNPTEAMEEILYTYLSTIATTYGIVLDHSVANTRNVYTILQALDSLADVMDSDKLYITDVLDSDISKVYKIVNILERHTTLDNVTLSEMINGVTTTLLDNIRTIASVILEDNDLITSSEILTFFVNISKKHTVIGARLYNETNYLDNTALELLRLHWGEVNFAYLAEEVYSLLILGRDSRFRVMSKFTEVFEAVLEEDTIKSVSERVEELDKEYSSVVSELFYIEDE